MRSVSKSKGVELLLWLGALLCFGFCSVAAMHARQARQRALQQFPPESPSAASLVPAANRVDGATSGDTHIEGRVEIKRLGLSVPVLSTCSDAALRLGSCHIQGTAVAGGLGNMGVAGHRDSSFRPLRNIRKGDVVDVFSSGGHFRYTVTGMGIVAADDTSVLAIGSEPELTLVTCYPFRYIGSAPQRFIVHARLNSVDGAE